TVFDTSKLKLDCGALAILTPLSPRTWLRAAREVAAFSPDCVVIQWWNTFFSPMVGTLASLLRRAGLKCVVECHNVLPHERRWFDGPLVKSAFSPVDQFITHSQADRETLLRLLPQKRVIVAALPIVEEFAADRRRERTGRAILFFGIVRKYKGLDVLMKALPKVLAKVDCDLTIAGEFYEPVEKYEALARELGIEGKVRIENRYVPNEEVPALFDSADVLVLPYLSATQSGIARIATSNGLPIIASRTGGLSESVEDRVTGRLFPPGDVEALANCLMDYFTTGEGELFAGNLRAARNGTQETPLVEIIERAAQFAGRC
ncbi:MAG TPA: glycosyltransferase, partial [Blastocatellia bacterium]|nr:glycosyltransferase [Blastocatellia bacterium]